MDRRRFLVGIGAASLGGSALVGTGAFSRVESQRAVTIQVAEDPDAYLGLDKCDTPNGSYAHLDDDGHLELLMNPDNPTVGESPLGEGINSNSNTWFDNVFQICNQGKQDVCVWISDDDDWPVVPDGEPGAGERRVDFYLGDDDAESIVGEANAFQLPLGQCVCVGLRTRSHGLASGDELLAAMDNGIELIADVDCNDDDPGEDCVECHPESGNRVETLTFQNLGAEKDIEVVDEGPPGQGGDTVIFDDTVPSGGTFTVEEETQGQPNLLFHVDGSGPITVWNPDTEEDTEEFHISCSMTIEPGQLLHPELSPGNELQVVSAADGDGNPLCPSG